MKLKSLFALALFGFSTVATANVAMEMFQMQRQMGALLNADSADEFKQGADAFIKAATEAKTKMPASLDDDQARFEQYQKDMQALIDTVNQANELASQGKLEEAKTVTQKLQQLKKTGHNEYK